MKKSWISLVHLSWWTIWKERNARIFQKKAAPLNQIQARLTEEAIRWASRQIKGLLAVE
jgi:hypothetical protein